MKRIANRLLAALLCAALLAALSVSAAAYDTSALRQVAYCGDAAACRMEPAAARAFADRLEQIAEAERRSNGDGADFSVLSMLLAPGPDGLPVLLAAVDYEYSVKLSLWEYRDGQTAEVDFENAAKTLLRHTEPEHVYLFSVETGTLNGTGALKFVYDDGLGHPKMNLYYSVAQGQCALKYHAESYSYYEQEGDGYVHRTDLEFNGTVYPNAIEPSEALVPFRSAQSLFLGVEFPGYNEPAMHRYDVRPSDERSMTLALRTYAAQGQAWTALNGMAYYGARESCRMKPQTALAYAAAIDRTDGAVVKALLFDAGGDAPLLWVAWGVDAQSGLDWPYGEQVYGFENGALVTYPDMTMLLRQGENGVIARYGLTEYSDYDYAFELYRLSGGRIAAEPFAGGVYSNMNGSTLNGKRVSEPWSSLTMRELFAMAEPDLEWLAGAESGGLDGFMHLRGGWSDADTAAQALRSYAAAVAPKVSANASAVQWTDATPYIDENDRTMVPLRAVADALGLTVSWDGVKREASFSDGSRTLTFPIGASTAIGSDGKTVQMDTAAVIFCDRTYAPVRYLAEYFGYTVGWDAATRTVLLTK